MKKTIRDLVLSNKRVIIRCDFNVPMKDGKITDDNRIIESLPTIKYAIENDAKVILMSHLGRVETEEDKVSNSLMPVSKKLSELLNQDVLFIPYTRGIELENAVNQLKDGEILLMENTRFEDIEGKKESKNDPELGKYWASLGEVFINDAFGTAHRAHASNVGIASILPNAVGFLMEKEIKMIKNVLDNPEHPLDVILGGAKVEDKIGVISNLVKIADHILIGGGMAYTFLKAKGFEIGESLVDNNHVDFCKEMIEKYPDKIVLPIDVVCASEINADAAIAVRNITMINNVEMGLDIGPRTLELFAEYLKDSKIVIWNGPMGVFEIEQFAKGTKGICEVLVNINGKTIVGGGDTAAAVIKYGYQDKMTHVSTGGGASLELLEGKDLPGISIINEIE